MTNSELWNSCSACEFSNDDIVQGAGGVYAGFAKHAFHMRNSYHLPTKNVPLFTSSPGSATIRQLHWDFISNHLLNMFSI